MAPAAPSSYQTATPLANGGAPTVIFPLVEIISMRNNAWRVNVICEKGPGTLHRLIERIEQAALRLMHVDVLMNGHLLELRSVALLQHYENRSCESSTRNLMAEFLSLSSLRVTGTKGVLQETSPL
ncbi:hypothetical protein KP509_01G117700 [Ceratopteris richardii]|uniref:Uncharacterized protein n=1 Tax=Ceratopteris richardii TaxID=49495 RepID=A0A8T2VQD1_CERRI|nr:hypothetical protein KP509_01G117700 [Ceratopteris richardii]